MPNLDSIVTRINDSMQTNGFKSRKFQGSLYLGIADEVKTIDGEDDARVETIEPGVIDNDGEVTDVSYDDNYPLVIFHRVMDLKYEVAPENYGPPGTTMQETASMKVVVGGSRSRVQTNENNIIASVALDFPKEFTPTVVSTLGMNSCIIEMGQVNPHIYSVWDEHWKGIPCTLGPNIFLFSIDYQVISTYNKNCFNLCE